MHFATFKIINLIYRFKTNSDWLRNHRIRTKLAKRLPPIISVQTIDHISQYLNIVLEICHSNSVRCDDLFFYRLMIVRSLRKFRRLSQ